jgi:DNA-binding NarL/FixJ family response regulator
VEEDHGVPIEVVTVGDAPVSDRGSALVAAAREALTNAAKFAGDAGPSPCSPRPTTTGTSRSSCAIGRGLRPGRGAPGPRGVRDSILGRMERHGGRAVVGPAPGGGTEVELVLEAVSLVTSVVVVDDHAIFRRGVRAELEGRVDVLADAGSVEEAARLILELRPDVVLLDVHMPGGGGVEVIRQVAQSRPAQCFLALSVSDAADDVIAVIRAGARGYVTKTIGGDELADAIRRVSEGDASSRRGSPGSSSTPSRNARARGGRPGARPAHRAGARGAAPPRPGLPLQGDRAPAGDLDQDGRGARQRRAAQAATLQPP